MATAAERRKVRKARQQKQENSEEVESNDSQFEEGHGGITQKTRDKNIIDYWRTMVGKTLVTLKNQIHDANKQGVDVGTVAEMDLDDYIKELNPYKIK